MITLINEKRYEKKGINFKRAYHLDWRGSKDGDTYVDGTPIERPYTTIVSIKDFRIDEDNIYHANDAGPIPLTGHSRTNMAYGKTRSYKNRPYDTQAVYWVEDDWVYQGTIRIWDNE